MSTFTITFATGGVPENSGSNLKVLCHVRRQTYHEQHPQQSRAAEEKKRGRGKSTLVLSRGNERKERNSVGWGSPWSSGLLIRIHAVAAAPSVSDGAITISAEGPLKLQISFILIPFHAFHFPCSC